MIVIWLILFLFLLLLIGLLIWDIYERFQPKYKASLKLPGQINLPIIGNLWDIAFLSTGKFAYLYNLKNSN